MVRSSTARRLCPSMESLRTLKIIFVAMIGLTILALIAIWRSETTNVSGEKISSEATVLSCYENQMKLEKNFEPNLPVIYFITPTYPRREQIPEITRLGQTLMHVKNLHWIVADDNEACNPSLVKLLKKFEIPLTVMATPMPKVFRKRNKSEAPRGVANRRASLSWVRNNALSGVIYFGDDDNTFDLELFDEIRRTKKVSMMPVGLIGDFGVSSPVIKEGKVIGFFDGWPGNRKFAIDMAGFAVSVQFLRQSPDATMPFKVGYEEDMFLQNLGLSIDDIEPLADGCTKILVWHTQTTNKPQPNLKLVHQESGTSLDRLLDELYKSGVATTSHVKGIKTFYTRDNHRTEI